MMSNAMSVDMNNDQMELHFAEPWFHRTVHHGRVGAEGIVMFLVYLFKHDFLKYYGITYRIAPSKF